MLKLPPEDAKWIRDVLGRLADDPEARRAHVFMSQRLGIPALEDIAGPRPGNALTPAGAIAFTKEDVPPRPSTKAEVDAFRARRDELKRRRSAGLPDVAAARAEVVENAPAELREAVQKAVETVHDETAAEIDLDSIIGAGSDD
jgi:hypothetical protein